MDDLISRQAAITALSNEIVKRRLLDEMYDGCIDEFQTEEILKKLPTAQPERIKGHWVLDRSGAYCCSECMEPCAGYVMMKPRDKFCKMCGSRNEVTE